MFYLESERRCWVWHQTIIKFVYLCLCLLLLFFISFIFPLLFAFKIILFIMCISLSLNHSNLYISHLIFEIPNSSPPPPLLGSHTWATKNKKLLKEGCPIMITYNFYLFLGYMIRISNYTRSFGNKSLEFNGFGMVVSILSSSITLWMEISIPSSFALLTETTVMTFYTFGIPLHLRSFILFIA